jgi:hypothetical protein
MGDSPWRPWPPRRLLDKRSKKRKIAWSAEMEKMKAIHHHFLLVKSPFFEYWGEGSTQTSTISQGQYK